MGASWGKMEADQEELQAIQQKTECVKTMHVFTAP
jgi:hypothetical protein